MTLSERSLLSGLGSGVEIQSAIPSSQRVPAPNVAMQAQNNQQEPREQMNSRADLRFSNLSTTPTWRGRGALACNLLTGFVGLLHGM